MVVFVALVVANQFILFQGEDKLERELPHTKNCPEIIPAERAEGASEASNWSEAREEGRKIIMARG